MIPQGEHCGVEVLGFRPDRERGKEFFPAMRTLEHEGSGSEQQGLQPIRFPRAAAQRRTNPGWAGDPRKSGQTDTSLEHQFITVMGS